MTKQTEALRMAIEAFDWEKVNKKCNIDILTMVMDFSNGQISASDLMNAIAYRCQVTLDLAYKDALENLEKDPPISRNEQPAEGIELEWYCKGWDDAEKDLATQEPVGYIDEYGNFENSMKMWMEEERNGAWIPVYTAPPKAETQEPVAKPKMDYDDPVWLKVGMEHSYNKRLLEALSDLEHQQWMKWAQSIIDSEPISEARKQRWATMMVDYKDLPDNIQEYDREWARKVMTIAHPVPSWQGLSDDEIVTTIDNTHFNEDEFCFLEACINYCRAIEQALKKKNNA